MQNQSPKPKNKPVDYEMLGRLIADVYEKGYMNRWRMYRMSFMRGIFAGFGGVIGATILVGLVAWILSIFDAVPLVEDIRTTIEEGR